MNTKNNSTSGSLYTATAKFITKFEKWKSINSELITSATELTESSLVTMFATAISINQWPALKKQTVESNRLSFSSHYKDSVGANGSATFYNKLVIGLQDLIDKVTEVNKTNTGAVLIPFGDLAIRLIHRYDTGGKFWYLTAQLCSFDNQSIGTANEEIYNLYALTPVEKYFNIKPTAIENYANDLAGNVLSHHCADYFTNVKLDNALVTEINQNTKSVTMAWNEFLELYNDNKTLLNPNTPDNFKIIFESGTHEFNTGYDSPITYPHCVMVYLSDLADVALLGNGYFSFGDFKNKAANLNSICPLRCQQLAFPVGFVPRP